MLNVRDKINYWASPYLWKKKEAGALMKILHAEKIKPFEHHIPNVTDSIVKEKFIRDNHKYFHDEYIKQFNGKFLIDPRSGFLIDQDGAIILDSVVFDHYGIYPDKLKINKRDHTTQLSKVVLFDHYWSANYFHFYSDVIGKLFLIKEKAPHLKELPIIISEKISNSRAFKFFMQFDTISSFNWYVQKPDEIIEANEAYILQPMPYEKKYWDNIKSLVADYTRPFEPNKKIFINRPASTGRYISNFEELRPYIIAAGYEIEEMENKSLEEQIALFSSAAVVVSIHGAAMANLVFCDTRCKVLEVMAVNHINSHYYWLSNILGMSKYDCLLGDELKVKRIFYPKGRFYLDPIRTKEQLEKFANNCALENN